jgi:hypothetical protein
MEILGKRSLRGERAGRPMVSPLTWLNFIPASGSDADEGNPSSCADDGVRGKDDDVAMQVDEQAVVDDSHIRESPQVRETGVQDSERHGPFAA